MSGDSEDVVYPDARLTITSQPTNASVVANTGGSNTATFTFGVTSTPDATITYQWQYDDSGTWANVEDDTPANTTYTGATTETLVIIPTDVDANAAMYRVTASSTGADSVVSANVVLTVV